MIIKYKKIRLNEPAFKPEKRDGDADYDLKVSKDITILGEGITGAPTNIAIEFPDGWEGVLESKSGLALKKWIVVEGGIIDNSYTGEIVVILHNISKEPVSFKKGDKIAQIKLRQQSPAFSFEETLDNLKETDRNSGGFGSTGK